MQPLLCLHKPVYFQASIGQALLKAKHAPKIFVLRLLDIFSLIILAWGGYSGFKRGLVLEIFSIGALVLAVLGSINLLDGAVALCTQWYYDQRGLLPYVAFVLLFVTIFIAITLVGKCFKALIKPTLVGSLDRLLGSILGIFKWGIYGSAFLWIGGLVQLKIPEAYTDGTFLFPIIASLCPKLLAWCAAWIPSIQEWLISTDTPQND
jgi:membrane protein required for colicin V production